MKMPSLLTTTICSTQSRHRSLSNSYKLVSFRHFWAIFKWTQMDTKWTQNEHSPHTLVLYNVFHVREHIWVGIEPSTKPAGALFAAEIDGHFIDYGWSVHNVWPSVRAEVVFIRQHTWLARPVGHLDHFSTPTAQISHRCPSPQSTFPTYFSVPPPEDTSQRPPHIETRQDRVHNTKLKSRFKHLWKV